MDRIAGKRTKASNRETVGEPGCCRCGRKDRCPKHCPEPEPEPCVCDVRLEDLIGPRGLASLIGAIGAAGVQDLVGELGPAGVTGLVGGIGVQGIAGLASAIGLPGLIGLTGEIGPAGVAGAVGAAGIQGLAGLIGEMGIQGVAGIVGPQGTAGLAGSLGLMGPQGPAGPAGVPGPAGPAGAQGTTAPQGAAGTSAVSAYAYIYNLTSRVVAVEADVLFDFNGPLTAGVTHTPGSAAVNIVDAGTYRVTYSTSTTEPSQFALTVNGAPAPETVYGSGAGTQQNDGQAILTLGAGDTLTLRNHTSAAAVTLQPLAGGTQGNVNASLVIERLA